MGVRSLFGRAFTAGKSVYTGPHPVEAGTVQWLRDLDDALKLCKRTGKPIFVLFQEVPGCAKCKQFGKDVLSHQQVVKAIEDEFVPLLIHNNSPGKDAQVCKAFGEPAWNYQVVRFLNESADDILPRKDQVWETGPLVRRMILVLETLGRPVPEYLGTLCDRC